MFAMHLCGGPPLVEGLGSRAVVEGLVLSAVRIRNWKLLPTATDKYILTK